MIILSAAERSSLEELRLISTQLRSSEALQYYLLADKDRQGIKPIDKVLKVTKPVEVLVTPYLAKMALIERF